MATDGSRPRLGRFTAANVDHPKIEGDLAVQTAQETGDFDAAPGFGAELTVDPNPVLARYASRDLSPFNHSG